MELPKWGILQKNYPNLEAEKVFKSIGGKVEYNYDIGVFSKKRGQRTIVSNIRGKITPTPFTVDPIYSAT